MSLGVLIGTGVTLIFHNPLLGAVMGAAMVINNLAAGLGGILVPVTLDRLEIDPAVSSAVFVTTITDVPASSASSGLRRWSDWAAKPLEAVAVERVCH